MLRGELVVKPDLAEVVAAAAARMAQAAAERGRFRVALSDGKTPRALYQLLAGERRATIDWSRLVLSTFQRATGPARVWEKGAGLRRDGGAAP